MVMIDGIQPPKRPISAKKPAKLNLQDTDEPAFRPPETVAAAETAPVKDITEPFAPKLFTAPNTPKKAGKFHLIEKFKLLTKKQKIIAIIALIIMLGGLGA